ncbi:MAG: DEAD/DEAH box helicase, partial [Cellulosilyticaceae bacterium]
MNIEKNLLLLKGEDKTEAIEYCQYSNGKYLVKFNENQQAYEYAHGSVQWFTKPEEINIAHYHFYKDGKRLGTIKRAIVFEEYIKVIFENGQGRSYGKRELEVRKSTLLDKLSNNHLKYFAEIANAMGLQISDGTGLLAKQYEKINFVDESTILATYLNSKKYPIKIREGKKLIVPFGCNSSQMKAIKNASMYSLSVIKGPPGTGKTQTILNIIANILLEGKTVAVVSNNNAATENVLEKLEKYGLEDIVATLGCKENKQRFIENQRKEPLVFSVLNDEVREQYKERVEELQTELEEMLEKQNLLAQQKAMIDQMMLEKEHFNQYFEETYANHKDAFKMRRHCNADRLIKVWHQAEYGNISFIYKLWLVFVKGIGGWHFYELPVDEIIAILQKYYYEVKYEEMLKQYEELGQRLEQFNFKEKQKDLVDISLSLLYDVVGNRYHAKKQSVFTEEDLWKKPQKVNEAYPIILSTTHSIRGSLGYNYLYDYIIVDEASQVDLATGVLAMSCAKKMIVVGDEKQLPNVVPEDKKLRAVQIATQYDLKEGYHYEKYSLLTSILHVISDIHVVLLKEHYRCHPKIIQFCNQKFYNNQLVVMTEDKGEKDVLKVYQTVAGNHARGHFNQRQLDEIKLHVIPELNKVANDDALGIITPYKEQKQKMQVAIGCEDIAIDTVHKFQGREKDDIIIATVDNEVTAFVDDPNLLNVAVSRAKKRLRLVVTDKEKDRSTNISDLMRYIIYNNGELLEGNIYSVFDLLYKDYEKQLKGYLKDKKQVSNEISENLI